MIQGHLQGAAGLHFEEKNVLQGRCNINEIIFDLVFDVSHTIHRRIGRQGDEVRLFGTVSLFNGDLPVGKQNLLGRRVATGMAGSLEFVVNGLVARCVVNIVISSR